MEVDRRAFQSVNVGMTSIETVQDRFSGDDHLLLPAHAIWRCNLTALSQRYNLYFIALRDGIAVYRPTFPFQRLGSRPDLFIPPTLANSSAQGYIDSWHANNHPHDINHLMVSELGFEEVLVVCTDSGNLAAYHTSAVYEAIQRHPYTFSSEGRSDLVGLRAFFSHWVQESAWGLAVHKNGRMIAVSANTTYFVPHDDHSAKITVFAFALEHSDQSSQTEQGAEDCIMGNDEAEWHDWHSGDSGDSVPRRNRNYKIVLAGENGHANNIPSISMVNSDDDREGCWLLSCDIYGDVRCWQIWSGNCYSSWDFAEAPNHTGRMQQIRSSGGWMVAALDPASFRAATSMESFCGSRRVPQYHGSLAAPPTYDITNVVRLRTPGRSQRHPLISEDSDYDPDEQLGADEGADSWSDRDTEPISNRMASERAFIDIAIASDLDDLGMPRISYPSSSVDRDIDSSQAMTFSHHSPTYGFPSFQCDTEGSSSDQEMVAEELDVRRDADGSGTSHPPLDGQLIDDQPLDLGDSESEEPSVLSPEGDQSSSPDSGDSSMLSERTQRTSLDAGSSPYTESGSPTAPGDDNAGPSDDDSIDVENPAVLEAINVPSAQPHIPFIPTLHLSKCHLRLINLPHARYPHLFCANILKQDLPEGWNQGETEALQRLNMLQQIPELGIVIIGSQLGRVAICTLTKLLPAGTLGMRVDWILPTKRQENAGLRPPTKELLGIACGPIQGREVSGVEGDVHNDHLQWAEDRHVDGVDTTFDRKVVVLSRSLHLRPQENAEAQSSQKTSNRTHPTDRKARRRPSPSARTETRPWPKIPKQDEDWQVIDGPRRYRLMLTYSDMTVLTYEIGRDVEREDVAIMVDSEELGGS